MKRWSGLIFLAVVSLSVACKSGSGGPFGSGSPEAYYEQECRMTFCCRLGSCEGGDEGLCVPRCVKNTLKMLPPGSVPGTGGPKSLKEAHSFDQEMTQFGECIRFPENCAKPYTPQECAEVKACLRKLP